MNQMLTSDNSTDGEKTRITVSMPSRRNGRRFALVSTVLSQMQMPHKAVFPLLRRMTMKGLESKAANSDFCMITSKISADANLIITDRPVDYPNKKIIYIDYAFENYLNKPDSKDILFLPILFHPNLVSDEHYKAAAALSKAKKRPIRILFAGNCDPKVYDSPHFQTQYGLMNRIELMKTAQTRLTSDVIFPGSKDELDAAMQSGEFGNKFVWIDTNKFRLPQSEWLHLLSQAHYFFCTPGVQYPYCQNLNEAMACGSVPILQYPDFYDPRLESGNTCISFKNATDMEGAISTILHSEDIQQWETLSKAACAYHQDNLSLDAVKARLREFMNDPNAKKLTWVMAGKK